MTAIVAGATGTIGKGIAQKFCELGARVFVTDLGQRKLDGICWELGPRCRSLAADVTPAEQVKQVVEAAAGASGGRVNVLVNVAGLDEMN